MWIHSPFSQPWGRMAHGAGPRGLGQELVREGPGTRNLPPGSLRGRQAASRLRTLGGEQDWLKSTPPFCLLLSGPPLGFGKDSGQFQANSAPLRTRGGRSLWPWVDNSVPFPAPEARDVSEGVETRLRGRSCPLPAAWDVGLSVSPFISLRSQPICPSHNVEKRNQEESGSSGSHTRKSVSVFKVKLYFISKTVLDSPVLPFCPRG